MQLPDWLRSSQTEHQPTGWDRVRFFSARHNGALLLGLGLVMALLMVVGGVVLFGRVADGVRTSASASPTPSAHPAGEQGRRTTGPVRRVAGGLLAPPRRPCGCAAAKSTGPFTAAQVRTALESVRKALIESRVDISMFSGDPSRSSRCSPRRLANNSGETSRTAASCGTPRGWRRRRSGSSASRADGRVSYRATRQDGIRVLEVSTEFVWAYPFDVDLRAPAGASVVALRDQVVWQVPHPDDVPASARGLWVHLGGGRDLECGLRPTP